jgi:hypothetical protein
VYILLFLKRTLNFKVKGFSQPTKFFIDNKNKNYDESKLTTIEANFKFYASQYFPACENIEGYFYGYHFLPPQFKRINL